MATTVKALTTGNGKTDAQVDEILVKLPPVPDNVLVLIRKLSDRITALEP